MKYSCAYGYNHSSLTVSTHHFQLGQLTAVANQLKDWWVASHWLQVKGGSESDLHHAWV